MKMGLRRYLILALPVLGGLYTFVELQILSLFSNVDWPLSTSTQEALESSTSQAAYVTPLMERREIIENPFHEMSHAPLSLLPGELPGYTGWARAAMTASDDLLLDGVPSDYATVGSMYKTMVTCTLPRCSEGGAVFDLRAYGPAIIPGRTRDFNNGTYEFSFYFFDEGTYFVEAVLAFSKAPVVTSLPLPDQETPDVGFYEGFMLPDFPRFVKVSQPDPPVLDNHARACLLSDLLDTTHFSSVVKGRWKLVERARGPTAEYNITLEGYQQGTNSLGYQMEYTRRACRMPDLPELTQDVARRAASPKPPQKKHLVLIGDEDLQVQYQAFQALGLENLRVTFVPLKEGLLTRMDDLREMITEIVDEIYPAEPEPCECPEPVECECEEGDEECTCPEPEPCDCEEACECPEPVECECEEGDEECTCPEPEPCGCEEKCECEEGDEDCECSQLVEPCECEEGDEECLCPEVSEGSATEEEAPEVTEEATRRRRLEEEEPEREEKLIVVFNSGMADITKLCRKEWLDEWKDEIELTEDGQPPKCAALYQQLLTEAIAIIKEMPIDLLLWQSTGAGWPKWGNYGFAWMPHVPQTIPYHPSVCEFFNRLARPILERKGFSLLDAYWISLSRPDHRMVGKNHEISKAMAHSGPEIYDLLVRQLIVILTERFDTPGAQSALPPV